MGPGFTLREDKWSREKRRLTCSYLKGPNRKGRTWSRGGALFLSAFQPESYPEGQRNDTSKEAVVICLEQEDHVIFFACYKKHFSIPQWALWKTTGSTITLSCLHFCFFTLHILPFPSFTERFIHILFPLTGSPPSLATFPPIFARSGPVQMLVFINNEKQRRGGGGGTAQCFRSHQGMNNSQSGEKYLCVCVCVLLLPVSMWFYFTLRWRMWKCFLSHCDRTRHSDCVIICCSRCFRSFTHPK